MNHVFRPFLRHFVLVFFDDILIYSKTWKDHLTHVDKVLSLLTLTTAFPQTVQMCFWCIRSRILGSSSGKGWRQGGPEKD
jgi:hypothetical protein